METTMRSIKRGVPMTNSMRKAFEAVTRDFSGKPVPNYRLFSPVLAEDSVNQGNLEKLLP